MSDMKMRALEYVQNAAGGATLDSFLEDHEPIGSLLWRDLSLAGFVLHAADGRVMLTDAGRAAIAKATGA